MVKGLGEQSKRRCITKELQLEGSPGLQTNAKVAAPESGPHTHLRHRYGTLAPRVLALADGRPELLEPIATGLPYIGAEVLYAVREEMATHVRCV